MSTGKVRVMLALGVGGYVFIVMHALSRRWTSEAPDGVCPGPVRYGKHAVMLRSVAVGRAAYRVGASVCSTPVTPRAYCCFRSRQLAWSRKGCRPRGLSTWGRTNRVRARINTAFDVRSDSAANDPDAGSATLAGYHQMLWSRKLPGGGQFDFAPVQGRWGWELHTDSPAGPLTVSSDTFVNTYTHQPSYRQVSEELTADEKETFLAVAYTIGGFLVWPNVSQGGGTINQDRGFRRAIGDRADLTLECLRRFYSGLVDKPENPLGDTLGRYGSFLRLFGDFAGFVEFFLLGDLVNGDGSVRFFLPFDGFAGPGRPVDVAAWRAYRVAASAFVQDRNARIAEWDLASAFPG